MALPRDLTPPHFPGWSPCFPRSVGRAFTPAAPWRIQKWRVCGIAGFAFSRVATGLAPVRRGGFHIRPGRLCRRTVRRGEGTPPYVRPGGRGCPGWPKTQNLFVGAGFTAPAGAFRRPTAAQRRLLGRRSRPRNPAPPQTGPIWNRPLQRFAASPGSHVPGWSRALPPFVGAGFIPPAGVRGGARSAGRCEHRPLQRFAVL